jgi:hypothetical protein
MEPGFQAAEVPFLREESGKETDPAPAVTEDTEHIPSEVIHFFRYWRTRVDCHWVLDGSKVGDPLLLTYAVRTAV